MGVCMDLFSYVMLFISTCVQILSNINEIINEEYLSLS